MSIHLSPLLFQTGSPWQAAPSLQLLGDNRGTNARLKESNCSTFLLFLFYSEDCCIFIRSWWRNTHTHMHAHTCMHAHTHHRSDDCRRTKLEQEDILQRWAPPSAGEARSRTSCITAAVGNATRHSDGHIIPSFIPDTSSRTGTTLWLIKGIEPLKCARFSEEERVIKRQADREDGLQTYPSKTSQQSFVVCTLYWSFSFPFCM